MADNPATKILYDATGPAYFCDKHAEQLATIANCVGWVVSKSAPPPGAQCKKCK